MSKSVQLLKSLNVESPCEADWNSMVGNNVVRFCHHCNLQVHNFSEMRAVDALRLVKNSRGRLCVRFVRAGDVIASPPPKPTLLYSIKRRVSKIAAGAFGATLSLAAYGAGGAYARPPLSPEGGVAHSRYASLFQASAANYYTGMTAELAGTVIDPQGAVVPGATVTLVNDATKQELAVTTNDMGEYRFTPLAAGNFTLTVASPGFKIYKVEGVSLTGAGELRVNVSLEVGEITMGAVVVVVEPSEPLVKAVYDEDVQAVRELIAAGANVNVLDKAYDSTALSEAFLRGNSEIVRLLLKAGADPNQKNSKGQTAIMRMGDSSTAAILKELISAGANPEARDEDGDSALMMAARLEDPAMLKTLLSFGARVNERNEAGQTALMLAAKEGNIENVKVLIDALADLNVTDDDDWTALKYATDNDHDEVAELLKSYGGVE